jgi:hypothetical protein
MKEIIEAIATANGWVSVYGRKDFNNLYNEIEVENQANLFLEPPVIDDVHNDMGIVEKKVYSGFLTIGYSSDIDEKDYQARYDKYIKPIMDDIIGILKNEIRCGQDVLFNLWRTTEFVNAFDYNFDGVILEYNITIDE